MRSVIALFTCLVLAGCNMTPAERAALNQQLNQMSNDMKQYQITPQQLYQQPNTNQSPTWGTQNQQRNVTCYRATDGILRCWE